MNKTVISLNIIIFFVALGFFTLGLINRNEVVSTEDILNNIEDVLPASELYTNCDGSIYKNCYTVQDFEGTVSKGELVIGDSSFQLNSLGENIATITELNTDVVSLQGGVEGIIEAEDMDNLISSSNESNLCVTGTYVYIYKITDDVYSSNFEYQSDKGYIEMSRCNEETKINYHYDLLTL